MDTYICEVCGYEYDPGAGDPDNDVAEGTSWDKVPEDWLCPVCGAGKEAFEVA
jgi:rubredoxin